MNLEGGEGVGGGSFHGRELMRVYGRHPAPLKSWNCSGFRILLRGGVSKGLELKRTALGVEAVS